MRAEGSFKYPIRRHTPSFWTALAFMVVKGITQHMPPLEIVEDAPENTIDALGEQLHNSLRISPQSASTFISSDSLNSPCSPSTSASASTSHAASLSSISVSRASVTSSASTGPETQTSQAEPSPIIYSHSRNLRSIISSHYYPISTTRIQDLARPLGNLPSRYLASHGYSVEDVSIIFEAYTHANTGEQFITSLARRGMAVNEARFLLTLINQRDKT